MYITRKVGEHVSPAFRHVREEIRNGDYLSSGDFGIFVEPRCIDGFTEPEPIDTSRFYEDTDSDRESSLSQTSVVQQSRSSAIHRQTTDSHHFYT